MNKEFLLRICDPILTDYEVICQSYRFFHATAQLNMFHINKNKHSESIAKAIQVPYRPQQIFQEAKLLQKQIKGAQVIPNLYHVDTN